MVKRMEVRSHSLAHKGTHYLECSGTQSGILLQYLLHKDGSGWAYLRPLLACKAGCLPHYCPGPQAKISNQTVHAPKVHAQQRIKLIRRSKCVRQNTS